MKEPWIKGGPFLEVSFLYEIEINIIKTIEIIMNKLKLSIYPIEFMDSNLDELVDSFNKGYIFDSEDPNSVHIHSLKLRLYINIPEKRKATLSIDNVSSNMLMINFCFFGSQSDAYEWDQIGINTEDIIEFSKFFVNLFNLYKFTIGSIGIENYIISLFGDKMFPNECYSKEKIYQNLDISKINKFLYIMINNNFIDLNTIQFKTMEKVKESALLKINDL